MIRVDRVACLDEGGHSLRIYSNLGRERTCTYRDREKQLN